MNTKLKVLILAFPILTLAGCSSGQKASERTTETVETKTTSIPQPNPAPAANAAAQPSMTTPGQAAPVIVTPNPTLSGSATTAPFSQDQMQGMMDQCMAMHKDTQVCSERAMQDCQLSTDSTSCQNMMKNVKILRGQ